jgi:hypothetical protein
MNAGMGGRFWLRGSLSAAMAAAMLGGLVSVAHAQSAKSKKTPPAAAEPSKGYDYEHPEAQPATENLDMEM